MKKITLFVMLLTLSVTLFSQQIIPSPALPKQDYLKKSNTSKFIAWTLLGGGAAVLGIIGLSNLELDFGSVQKRSSPFVPIVIGAALMTGSIPFFIAASKNKRKARAAFAYFKMEHAPQLQQSSLIYKTVPSLTLKISL